MNLCKVALPQIGNWKKRLPTIEEAACEELDATIASPPPLSLSDPLRLAHNSCDAEAMVLRLKGCCKATRSQLFVWIGKALPTLALSEAGSKVVLAALEVAAGPERGMLTNEFQGSVLHLCASPFGAQVLVSVIQSMPTSAVAFVPQEMAGHSAEISRRRFGCDVLEAMTMHCSEAQMLSLAAELVQEASELARHPHGSSVIQHLLEYGNEGCRSAIIQHLLPEVPLFAMHRTASHVVEKAFNYGSLAEKQSIARAMLQASAPVSVADIACSRCGSSLLEDVANIEVFLGEFQPRLVEALPRLGQSKFGRRVLTSFRLMAPSSTGATSSGNHPHSAAVAA